MSEDEEHWFIDSLVWGPYQDALGQEVFLAGVSGLRYFGSEVDWILWEQQHNIQSKVVHMYMENLPVDAPQGEQLPSKMLEEAYANARKHLCNFDLQADNS